MPTALAEAIRASERDERQFFRIESLEHAVSVFEAARLLAVRCLASVHRYLSGDRAPRTLTEHYLPPMDGGGGAGGLADTPRP